MQRGHGSADRLQTENVDLGFIDRLVDGGGKGEDPDAVRMAAANNFLGPKRFGRMFPGLKPFRPPRAALEELGLGMKDAAPENRGNSSIPAGFTYLGQFVDHDITRDGTRGFPPITDPKLIEQLRTPVLDLDSVYGGGPKHSPNLYVPNIPPSRAVFKIGTTVPVNTGNPNFDVKEQLPNDLPRRPDGSPLVGDDRNDENLIVAQTHLAFLKFHNKIIGTLAQEADEDDGSATLTQTEEEERKSVPFHRARRQVRWHYQWIVLNDFLPRIIEPGILNDIRANGRKFYDFGRDPFDGAPFMPIEFSAAAYRLGHSMVRENYNFNRVFSDPAVVPNASFAATLGLLFTFTHNGGGAPIPSNWAIDWRRFFKTGDRDLRNFARTLDTRLVKQLHKLPGFPPGPLQSLAVRNLLRGSRIGLPSAQDVVEAMKKKVSVTALTPAEIASGNDGERVVKHGFHRKTPLWYYILKEAEVQGEGERLGEVGSRIVGEVFWGLLQGDENSFVSRQPDWEPRLDSSTPGDFKMVDLLRFVGDINPIG